MTILFDTKISFYNVSSKWYQMEFSEAENY